VIEYKKGKKKMFPKKTLQPRKYAYILEEVSSYIDPIYASGIKNSAFKFFELVVISRI